MVAVLCGRITANGMLRSGTPIEHYPQYGLYVKREDRACLPPGPPFSKTRGVWAYLLKRPEKIIGVLDTYHSQAGHAVARACQLLGKQCINFYPEFKHEPGPREPQLRAKALGAILQGLPAGRSAILFHQAKKQTLEQEGWIMPNALKLPESVTETALEVPAEKFDWVIIPASSGTIASGVIKGMGLRCRYLVHLGYSRSVESVKEYVVSQSGVDGAEIEIIDEGYAYKDKAKAGETPPWPCNDYYDLKAFRWWLKVKEDYPGRVLFWNVG